MSVFSLQTICLSRCFQEDELTHPEILHDIVGKFNRSRLGQIQKIQESAISKLIKDVLFAYRSHSNVELQDLRDKLSPNGLFGKRHLSRMYQYGYKFDRYAKSHNYWFPYGNAREMMNLCGFWLKRIGDDFQEGMLCSFYQMAEWAQTREILAIMPDHENNLLTQPTALLLCLRKIADLGVLEAQSTLNHAYSKNYLGKKRHAMQLHLSLDDRIAGLKNLIHLGYLESGNSLGHLYRTEKSISEEKRREGMQELMRMELEQGVFFHSVTSCIINEHIGSLEWDHPLEEQIEKLIQRAKQGDAYAFSCVWKMYTRNELGRKTLTLQLDEGQRLAKLEELKTPRNEELYKNHFIHWTKNPTPISDQLDCLEKHVFEDKHIPLLDTLITCYLKNSWKEKALNIAFETRLEKLKMLISLFPQSSRPIKIVAKYYTSEIMSNFKEEIQQVPERARQILELLPFPSRFDYILNLAIQTRSWEFIKDYLAPNMKNPILQDIFRHAAGHGMAFS